MVAHAFNSSSLEAGAEGLQIEVQYGSLGDLMHRHVQELTQHLAADGSVGAPTRRGLVLLSKGKPGTVLDLTPLYIPLYIKGFYQ